MPPHQKEALIHYLKSLCIRKAFIRETLLQENQIFPKGFLILEGELKISKKVGDNHVVLARLGPLQVANL